jgi:hypothetical protein
MEALGCYVVWATFPIMQCYEPKNYECKIDNLAFSKLINQLIGKLTYYLVSSFKKGMKSYLMKHSTMKMYGGSGFVAPHILNTRN